MCGIAGRANVFTGRPVDADVVRAMTDCLAHRGPNSSGLHVDGAVGLGHRRLAIIDLSPGGHQPKSSADGRYWITFNGEIYNYRELRVQLEQRGRRFTSSSDTEVLLQCYEEYGADCLHHLRGMFAFAIWDAVERRLFLARDRVGKKPLFYRTDRDGLAFASGSKAFFAEPSFVPTVNREAIAHFVGLLYVPSPLSAFEGAAVLPPAHYLVADAAGVKTTRYWRLRYEPKHRWSDEEATEAVIEKLREAVRLRLVSDVPLGAFLSGGVDSATIVALMAELGGQNGRVRTYTIGFEEEGFNERDRARQIATHFGTDHHELTVRPNILDDLPRMVWHYGEPYADSSSVPTYYLARLTREHVTVALNGDAGDENFAGYDCYAAASHDDWYDRLPHQLRRAAAQTVRLFAGRTAWRGTGARLRDALDRRVLSRESRYARSRLHTTAALRHALLTTEFASSLDPDATAQLTTRRFAETDAREWVDRMLAVDVETYLPDMLLAKVDIATMAFGLEGRAPFLDHEFMELAARLPAKMKLCGGEQKYLLKRVATRLLPAGYVSGPKRGFSVPIVEWLRGDLRALTEEVLLDGRCAARGVLREDTIRQILNDHWAGLVDRHELIWGLMMLELWWRQFLDARPPLS